MIIVRISKILNTSPTTRRCECECPLDGGYNGTRDIIGEPEPGDLLVLIPVNWLTGGYDKRKVRATDIFQYRRQQNL